jgi:hypothetical protein
MPGPQQRLEEMGVQANNPTFPKPKQGNAHPGKHRKFLPFHIHQFATLEIDTVPVTEAETQKATATVAFFVPLTPFTGQI